MSKVPNDLHYTKDHEWVLVEDSVAAIGITDYAQSELGDITFVELPEDDAEFNAGDEIAQIESVKAASPVFSPITGNILELNTELEDEPGAINSDPYGAGWICKIEVSKPEEIESLMTAEQYEVFLAEEGEDD